MESEYKMVTIAELKQVENQRRAILSKLTGAPKEDWELVDSKDDNRHLFEFLQRGLIECIDIKGNNWFYLTEAGWEFMGYQAPDDAGEPCCSFCDGSGKEATDDVDEPDCEACDGSGLDPVTLWGYGDLHYLDEEA